MGDEGYVVSFPPSSVKAVLETFKRSFITASDRNKKTYERVTLSFCREVEKIEGH